jgi:hypothetical protein
MEDYWTKEMFLKVKSTLAKKQAKIATAATIKNKKETSKSLREFDMEIYNRILLTQGNWNTPTTAAAVYVSPEERLLSSTSGTGLTLSVVANDISAPSDLNTSSPT